MRESASFAGEGLQLSQAKDIVKVGKGVLDLKTDNELESEALTPSIVKSLEVVIGCYQEKVEEIQKSLKKAEAWMTEAKELIGKESVTMEEFDNLLETAEDVGVENEDVSKKIRAEMGRCKAWGVKADAALVGAKLGLNAMKKLIGEGEKIKVSCKTLCTSVSKDPFCAGETLSSCDCSRRSLVAIASCWVHQPNVWH